MNEYFISITEPGTVEYPLHQHPDWEIMYYLEGTGYLVTGNVNHAFEPGSIMIVPPGVAHGSSSGNGFVNISIGGDFSSLFLFDRIVSLSDDPGKNGRQLAKLIYENRYANIEYLSALCGAYAHFLLQNTNLQKRSAQAVRRIVEQVQRHFSDSQFRITAVLNQSGYTEDYIRAEFKKATSLTPVDFLAKVRVEHAGKLFEIYGQSRSVSEIAWACGFEDPIYFSRRFRQFMGMSPAEYRKQANNKQGRTERLHKMQEKILDKL